MSKMRLKAIVLVGQRYVLSCLTLFHFKLLYFLLLDGATFYVIVIVFLIVFLNIKILRMTQFKAETCCCARLVA